jgi:hypothetical protein
MGEPLKPKGGCTMQSLKVGGVEHRCFNASIAFSLRSYEKVWSIKMGSFSNTSGTLGHGNQGRKSYVITKSKNAIDSSR